MLRMYCDTATDASLWLLHFEAGVLFVDLAATTEVDVDMDSEDELVAETPTQTAGVMAAHCEKTHAAAATPTAGAGQQGLAVPCSGGLRERIQSFKDAKVQLMD